MITLIFIGIAAFFGTAAYFWNELADLATSAINWLRTKNPWAARAVEKIFLRIDSVMVGTRRSVKKVRRFLEVIFQNGEKREQDLGDISFDDLDPAIKQQIRSNDTKRFQMKVLQ